MPFTLLLVAHLVEFEATFNSGAKKKIIHSLFQFIFVPQFQFPVSDGTARKCKAEHVCSLFCPLVLKPHKQQSRNNSKHYFGSLAVFV